MNITGTEQPQVHQSHQYPGKLDSTGHPNQHIQLKHQHHSEESLVLDIPTENPIVHPKPSADPVP